MTSQKLTFPFEILLGSQSPRRKDILEKAGIDFSILPIGYEEIMPTHLHSISDIPVYLAEQKALHARTLHEKELLITADTLVFLGELVIGKPRDEEDAFDILQNLSGKMHQVISGVCLKYGEVTELISDTSRVYFKELDMAEIEYYIEHYDVLDKAGAYGVQDWMGLIGIEKIEGSYFNVMGFPIQKVYDKLKEIENKL